MTILSTIKRDIESFPYHVAVGTDLTSDIATLVKAQSKSRKVYLLADPIYLRTSLHELPGALRLHGFSVVERLLPAGKENKTINLALELISELIREEFTRDATFVAIGGGVIGDLGGLVASLFYRGLRLVHVPTTLTAQVDSSLGGKVAVNFNNTINSVGTFYHPHLVAIDLSLLVALPKREFLAGMAEVIKVAFIADRDFLGYLRDHREAILNRDIETLRHVVTRSVEIKLAHVNGDVRDAANRMYLNYGHTIGQAVETATGLEREHYRHGEAVAIGMMGAAMLADAIYGAGSRAEEHREILEAYSLPVAIDASLSGRDPSELHSDILRCIYKDKKRNAKGHRFVLVPESGTAELRQVASDGPLNDVVYRLINA